MDHDAGSALVVFFIFGAPVTAWIISRVLAHQERMEMIRNGFVPPPDKRAMRDSARYGWQAGQMPPPPPGGPIPPAAMPYQAYPDPNFYAQAQMRKGIMVTLVGFALLIGLSFIGSRGDGSFQGGPWLLGGLIPMFVGVAQVINAVLNGAQIPRLGGYSAPTNQSGNFGPRPTPPPQSPPQPPAPGPYAWRPGSTPEIEKPVPPPDPRS